MTKVSKHWTEQEFAGLDLGDGRLNKGENIDGTIYGEPDSEHPDGL